MEFRTLDAVEQSALELLRQINWHDILLNQQVVAAFVFRNHAGDAGTSDRDWPPRPPFQFTELLIRQQQHRRILQRLAVRFKGEFCRSRLSP